MTWSKLHAQLLSGAFELVLSKADPGTMAFVRCLTPDVVEHMAGDAGFAPRGWHVHRVADSSNKSRRTITADQAVELREAKDVAALLLVDTATAGAGMDGIYSAAQEVNEASLFKEALRLAGKALPTPYRKDAERALKKARGHGHRYSISPWTEFDYYVQSATEGRHPGEYLYLLGLWPVQHEDGDDLEQALDLARIFVDRLLGTSVSGQTPRQRIESLKLHSPSDAQMTELEQFVRAAASRPLLAGLAELAEKPGLWVNALRMESAAQTIRRIRISDWRTAAGKMTKWSGLADGAEGQPPEFRLNQDADKTGEYSKLEVHWNAEPDELKEGSAEYHIAIMTDQDEELASRDVPHGKRKEQKSRFTNDDFAMLNEEAVIPAKVVITVIDNDQVERVESEEFTIRFGHAPGKESAGVGKKVRTLIEGLIELETRDGVSALAGSGEPLTVDSKNFVLLRTGQSGKSYRVYCPPLIREVERQWAERSGAIGRWRVSVRASGSRAGDPEFIPMTLSETASDAAPLRDRVAAAGRKMAERFLASSGAGQIYDEQARLFDGVKDYVLAWAALLEKGDPALALANTVEVQTLSGRTVGLIVLPSHPLRVAWHVAYDNLVLHTAYEEAAKPKDIRQEFLVMDGAMFPAFLPGLDGGSTFVFADTLGFHAVGMVPDSDKEPKAAVAILARALGETESADSAPTVGKQSAHVLGNEILKYIACHDTSKVLHIHALRPGDGLTVARSLGQVQEQLKKRLPDSDNDESERGAAPSFVLELYPSYEQRGVAGRFIAEAREKRRSGAGVLAPEDRWMLESLSLPGGMNLPRLRWARKREAEPRTPAHVAVAFDSFESRVAPYEDAAERERPLFAYGLVSFFERDYTSVPSPLWHSTLLSSDTGEKHPSDKAHTDRLVRLQLAVEMAVARSLGAPGARPTLRTEISQEKAHHLRELHRLSDWVITLDRNAGIEYFDSPRDNQEIYDAYVIDCVPEREDLGCLQLITSTSSLDEVRILLDAALDQMGLSHSRRNAEFLMNHLKALSGRLAIRLTGQKAPTSELIALALSHAGCEGASDEDECWLSLQDGFLIPVDDVLDLIPPLMGRANDPEEASHIDTAGAARPDMIYVSMAPRKGLTFQFVEVKYRRHLRATRGLDVLDGIHGQARALRKRWEQWYSDEEMPPPFRTVRRMKLARVLRFYADKARRHLLSEERYQSLISEIDRMVEKGSNYLFNQSERGDRGWVFCPEFGGASPMLIAPAEWETRIFLFGPKQLEDSDLRRESTLVPPEDDGAGDGHRGGEPEVEVGQPHGSDTGVSPAGASAAATGTEGASGMSGALLGADPTICLGTDSLTGAEVRWPLTVRGNPHLLLAGLPGMGKTTCLLNLCKQMLDAGVRPIVFSYHQDIDERLQQTTDVRFIDFHGLGFNPLQVIDRQSRMAYLDVAGAVRDIFVAIYPELGDIQGEHIRTAIKESFREQGWDDPNADLATLLEPPFKRFVEILRAKARPDRGLQMLLVRLSELDDYGFFAPGESQQSLWDSPQPLVIRIHSTQNDILQKAFASLVFYSLYKNMFRRGIQTRITHAVVFDEAHRAARLQLIPTMAKECRKYGISLILASQEAKDFNLSLFSAIANYLILRLNEVDAKALVRNVASSDQERALVDKIKQMDRFRALYFAEGKKRPSPVSLLP